MGVLTEITARKAAEWRRSGIDELAHVSRVSMMGQLASALAHELNCNRSAQSCVTPKRQSFFCEPARPIFRRRLADSAKTTSAPAM